MAGTTKRPVGIGKLNKQKKRKLEDSRSESPEKKIAGKEDTPEVATTEFSTESNELTVKLNEEVDPNDPISQLRGLWHTWLKSEKDNEMILNGVIHECDRMLTKVHNLSSDTKDKISKSEDNENEIKLNGEFYSIYALALAELASFHTINEDDLEDEEETEKKEEKKESVDDDDEVEKVKDFFDAAMERLEEGFEKFKDDEESLIDLNFAKSKTILSRIPLEYISSLKVEDKIKELPNLPNLKNLLDESIKSYEYSIKTIIKDISKYNKLINNENDYNLQMDILDSFDDLLDIVDNFGKHHEEGLDSDDEENEKLIEDNEVQLHKSHPLYAIKESDDYNLWWREQSLQLFELVKNNSKDDSENEDLKKLIRNISSKIGQSYLMEAEEPSSIYTMLEYYNDEENEAGNGEINGLTANEASKIAIELIKTAIKFLKEAYNDEDPQSWVNLAESEISLGNLYPLESELQEKYYQRAEKRLNKANNATHGKYQDILDNLLKKD
ncbi:hypothetical protein BVG19_g1435 [[Candida] boidinii]|nr:hypothetical protein BVG19_g1435 [[Candida] boidinii]OWB50850.1 hypothetical protein B5S27_g2403 [[Candida] boidinii]